MHRRLAGLAIVVVAGVVLLACPPAQAVTAGPTDRVTSSGATAGGTQAGTVAKGGGLSVTIDTISPVTIIPGRQVRLGGTLTNHAASTWFDAKVYFTISTDPATTKSALDSLSLDTGEPVGETIYTFGRFDELGAVRPGESKTYRLAIPYAELQISGAPGVYHVGATVIGQSAGEVRDTDPDALATTLMSLEPSGADANPTDVVTVIPVTAPVLRQPGGSFLNDDLATKLAYGGNLRNVIDFAAQAPDESLTLVLDPALVTAVRDMSQGYEVQSLIDSENGVDPRAGLGRADAITWLEDLDAVGSRQTLSLMPWGNPDATALAAASIPSSVEAAVRASRRFAVANGIGTSIVDCQSGGTNSRHGLAVARNAGAVVHLQSQAALTRLPPSDDNGYPPAVVTVPTHSGPLTAVVARDEVAGQRLTSRLSALELRQRLLAEGTIRALSSTRQPTSVVVTPLQWNPGNGAATLDLTALYGSSALRPLPLLTISERPTTAYQGPIKVSESRAMPDRLTDAIKRLRLNGGTYTQLLTDGRQASVEFDEQLASAGSAMWRVRPRLDRGLIRQLAGSLADSVDSVTLTVPGFVALSSDSGRFPITVRNGMDESVTVNVDMEPVNPALQLQAVKTLVLGPGQRADVDVVGHARGSGLTIVRARLRTASERAFGKRHDFDVRATQIGLAIWVVMGVLGALLFSSAAIRIVRRIRSGGFIPRGDTPR